MILFLGELLDVQEGEYNTLVFKSTRYDTGLKKEVECSQQVGIADTCEPFISNYKKHIGEVVAVGILPLKTKKNSIFLLSQTDILDISQVFQMEDGLTA